MSIRLTAMARRELGAQIAYLASVAPDAADQLVDRIAHAFTLLDSRLVDGPEVQLKDGRYVRRWLVPPLQLFYVQRQKSPEPLTSYPCRRRCCRTYRHSSPTCRRISWGRGHPLAS